MSSSFAFIPRSVGKGANQKLLNDRCHSKPTVAHVPQGSRLRFSTTHQHPIPIGSQTENAKRTDELLVLIEAALSDYSCWSNPELQHEMKLGQDGYMPLKRVIKHSPIFETLYPQPSDTEIMRCIRATPNSILEIRMLIAETSRRTYRPTDGGFEIRRRDWKVLLQTIAESGWDKEWWDQRTIYIERLPNAYYSINALGRYLQSLLSLLDEKFQPDSRRIQIQFITFPPHHLAAQGEPPRCKGFAFVVLESPTLVEILCRSFPWDNSFASSVTNVDKEAVKFEMRALSKASWEKLKVEYFTYQEHLLSHVAEEAGPLQLKVEKQNISSEWDSPNSSPPTLSAPTETKVQPIGFPQNCLVFVRNIHPDTNKTTLRILFSNLLTSCKGVLDYVDFSKGLDTCHLRLGSPSAASSLVLHFAAQHTAQLDALDQVGSAPTRERPKLELEIVRGKREELYWEQVPEKVRTAAAATLHGVGDYSITGKNESGPRRKRRKMG